MATQTQGHSAKVTMTLESGGRRVPVAQVGNSGILVRELESPIASGEALLHISIDGRAEQHVIVLPQGITEPNRFVEFF